MTIYLVEIPCQATASAISDQGKELVWTVMKDPERVLTRRLARWYPGNDIVNLIGQDPTAHAGFVAMLVAASLEGKPVAKVFNPIAF